MSTPAAAAAPTPANAATDTLPQARFVYEAIVDIGPREDLGMSPLGERFIIPITGGHFSGPGNGSQPLAGTVLPGGADRQLLRSDGVKELDALYEMRCDDGTVLTVHNKALIDAPVDGPRYAMSQLRISAPVDGPHAWLNRRILVGTVQGLMPEQQAVRIRVYQLV